MPASAPTQHSQSVPDRRTCRLTCGRTGCSSAVTTMSWPAPVPIAAILP